MLVDRLILDGTSPGLSQISFSHVWNNLQWSQHSFPSSSFQSLALSKGPWTLQNRGSCPSLVQHFHRVANAPQTEGSTDSGFKSAHHLWFISSGWLLKPFITAYWYKHTTQQKLFMPLDVTADFQSHCPELSPLILSSFLSWTGASQRCMDQSPLVCECLVPHLLAAPHLRTISSSHEVMSPSSLCLQWAGPTHTHTHTHTHTCNTGTHV